LTFSQHTLTIDDVVFEGGVIKDYLNETEKNIIIPDNFNGATVFEIGSWAFYDNQLTDVSIPNSVREIGGLAFKNNQLSTISIPSSVIEIGSSSFADNILTNVEIPNTLYSIPDYAFRNNEIIDVVIPSSVFYIGTQAFENNKIENLELPSTISFIRVGAFSNNKLTSLTIPNSMTEIREAVFSLNQLTLVTIPNAVTSIGDSAFASNKLGTINIPNTMTSIGSYAFRDNQLTSLDIPNSIHEINQETFSINLLTDVSIPNSITRIGNGAFKQNLLENITLPNSIIEIGSEGFSNNSMTGFVLPSPDIYVGEWNNGTAGNITTRFDIQYLYFAINYFAIDSDFIFENGEIKDYLGPQGDITIPNTINGQTVNSIGWNAFQNNNLTDVTLPQTLTSIGQGAFEGNSISNLILPNHHNNYVYSWQAREATGAPVNEEFFSGDDINGNYFYNILEAQRPFLFSITYLLNESINSNNPESYTIESDAIILEPTIKEGYIFDGWFDNPEFNGDPITQIQSGSTGSIEFHAKLTLETITYLSSNTKSQLNFYPNPCSNVIYITSINSDYITIYSLDGSLKLTSEQPKIDVSNLESGIYMIKQGERFSKLIKQ